MKSGIYKIENEANGKVYIGQSRNIKKRINEHFNNLRNNKHNNMHLQSSFNKYGENCFNAGIIEFCEIEQLTDKELYWMTYYESHIKSKGYNIDIPNHEMGAFQLSDETKDKISLANTKYTDDELTSYLHEFYYMEGVIPTQRELIKRGYPSSEVYFKRFGSFKNALKLAGLYDLVENKKMFERREYTRDEVTKLYKGFVEKYDRFPSSDEQRYTSKFNLPTVNLITKHFGSIEVLKEELGFGKSSMIKKENDDALDKLQQLYKQDGKVTARSIDKSKLTRSGKFYRNRFGDLSKACELANVPYALHI